MTSVCSTECIGLKHTKSCAFILKVCVKSTGYSTTSLRTVALVYIKIMIILYSAKTDFKISIRLVNFSELFMQRI